MPHNTYIIPVVAATLDLITPLNGGVTPAIEEPAGFFIYKGPDIPAVIVTNEELVDAFNEDAYFISMTLVTDQPPAPEPS